MKPNLDSLKLEIQEFLESEGFAIFYGHSRIVDSLPLVYWNCDEYPDYKQFVKAAKTAGTQLMVYNPSELTSDLVEDAIERLESIEMPRDELRKLDRRLKEMRVYEGFTCEIELSFDHASRIYVFDLRTEWYEELSDLMDDLDILGGDLAGEDEEPLGGYFSKN
ncbi:MAG: hypothetical protein ACR2NN_01135 [Bryobacteraceae bacterium]